MIKLVIKLGTLATFLVAINTAPSLTPAFAAGGGGGGGVENDMDQGRTYPAPSSYPKRSGAKATHTPKVKKTKNKSSIGAPAFSQGNPAAYRPAYDRNHYASG